jgi:hypothetical protein
MSAQVAAADFSLMFSCISWVVWVTAITKSILIPVCQEKRIEKYESTTDHRPASISDILILIMVMLVRTILADQLIRVIIALMGLAASTIGLMKVGME